MHFILLVFVSATSTVTCSATSLDTAFLAGSIDLQSLDVIPEYGWENLRLDYCNLCGPSKKKVMFGAREVTESGVKAIKLIVESDTNIISVKFAHIFWKYCLMAQIYSHFASCQTPMSPLDFDFYDAIFGNSECIQRRISHVAFIQVLVNSANKFEDMFVRNHDDHVVEAVVHSWFQQYRQKQRDRIEKRKDQISQRTNATFAFKQKVFLRHVVREWGYLKGTQFLGDECFHAWTLFSWRVMKTRMSNNSSRAQEQIQKKQSKIEDLSGKVQDLDMEVRKCVEEKEHLRKQIANHEHTIRQLRSNRKTK